MSIKNGEARRSKRFFLPRLLSAVTNYGAKRLPALQPSVKENWTMVARSALSRLAPTLSNARATSSVGARRAMQAARGYATADSEHSVRDLAS